MFNVGGGEILVILLLALLVLGPDKLPDAARKAGRYMHEFRRVTSGFQEEFRQAMDLGVSDATEAAASSADDAVHRTTAGPRLMAAPEVPTAPTDPEAEPASAPGPEPVSPADAPAPAAGAGSAPVAGVPSAPAGGPELITPRRPAAPPEDDAGTSSAA